MEEGIVHVDATAKVPIELSFRGMSYNGPVGVDIVFLIDNSGSMRNSGGTDENGVRYSAIEALASYYKSGGTEDREDLDRISIVSFSGEPDGSETVVWMDWSTWSETETFIQQLDDHPPPAGIYTPMAKGMELANHQFNTSNRFYKMVILLTDGYPESSHAAPDMVQEHEIQNVHIPYAKNHMILYSTILLGFPDEYASLLLSYIASETDYITNPPPDPPRFYFNTSDVNEIQSAYSDFFQGIFKRIVPHNIILSEKVNSMLIVDDVSLILNASIQNPVHPSTPLQDAIQQFEGIDGNFYIRLKELTGEAMLRFTVKLDINSGDVTDSMLNQDYIEVPVNHTDTDDSYIYYDSPSETGITTIGPLSIPQTKIRFLTGVHVSKELIAPQNGGFDEGHTVDIEMVNARASSLGWFWLKEFPSYYVDVSEIIDDYEFRPFEHIVKKIMKPIVSKWIIGQDVDWVDGDLFGVSYVKHWIDSYYDDIINAFSNTLDPYLSRFYFGLGRLGMQHGIFKLKQDIPARAEHHLNFKVKGSAFGDPPTQITRPVDNPAKKPPESSRYRHTGVEFWEYVEPNPDLSQIRLPGKRPELQIHTCFDRDIDQFFEKLVGIQNYEVPHSLIKTLDSEDIRPTGFYLENYDDLLDPIGLLVTIENKGTCTGNTAIRARSIIIPYPDVDIPVERWDTQQPRPMTAEKTKIIQINSREIKTTQVVYTHLSTVPTRVRTSPGTGFDHAKIEIDPDFVKKFTKTFKGFIINIVDVEPASGVGPDTRDEIWLCNNSAIEIVHIESPF